MEIQGIIKEIGETKTFGNNGFRKRELILTTQEQYPQHLLIEFVQDNFSMSRKGVLRGIHYQKEPFSQGKLVSVTSGSVYDVAVDLRKDSSTYLKWFGIELNEENGFQLWIPEGFGHAFLTLSESAHFCYKTTNFYNKDSEVTISWDDPKIAIDWSMFDLEIIISSKDLEGKNI